MSYTYTFEHWRPEAEEPDLYEIEYSVAPIRRSSRFAPASGGEITIDAVSPPIHHATDLWWAMCQAVEDAHDFSEDFAC